MDDNTYYFIQVIMLGYNFKLSFFLLKKKSKYINILGHVWSRWQYYVPYVYASYVDMPVDGNLIFKT